MKKTDLTKLHKTYYSATETPQIQSFGPARYLSVEGQGDPSGQAYRAHVQSLYGAAYTLKFMMKASGNDYVVSKLEGQWWFDHRKWRDIAIEDAPRLIPRDTWNYRLLLRLPDTVSPEDVESGLALARQKGKIAAGHTIAYFEMNEGTCVQILHVGPFEREPDTLVKLRTFMQAENWVHNGLHHEIYLSDFRKIAPEKLRTILREPVIMKS